MAWQVQEAKQRFSEVVRRAIDDGPQLVTRHGRDAVVVVSIEDFRRLSEGDLSLKGFLRAAPDLSRLEIERSRQSARRIDL